MKVLVVDDHQNIIDAVSLCISFRWPAAQVVAAYDGATGLEMIERETPDVVILDIGLPEMDGFQVLQQTRQFSRVPVIMLTVRDEDTDIARALQMGADDYISKPFSHVEFLARVEAVLRRASGRGADEQGPLVADDLWVDFGSAEVLMKGQPVQLTRTELGLLSHLMHNAGRVLSRRQLEATVWGSDDAVDIDSQTIKVHMRHLRSKLGDTADSPKYIANVYGIGYKFLKQVHAGTQPPPGRTGESANRTDTHDKLHNALPNLQ